MEKLYASNPRSSVDQQLVELVLELSGEGAGRIIGQFAALYAALVAALHGAVGPAVGARFLERVVRELDELIKKRGGRMDEPAPPPLILSAADAHLGRPSLEHLLGPMLLPAIEGGESHPAVVIKGIEVLGLYVSASWCSPCVQTTPLLAAAYKALRARGKMLDADGALFARQDGTLAYFFTLQRLAALAAAAGLELVECGALRRKYRNRQLGLELRRAAPALRQVPPTVPSAPPTTQEGR
jgi:thiol-disulfide isomerase/thioredoxin